MLIEITEAEKELLTQTELNVVDWLNEHENRIFDLSISDIAVETYSSPATVSRAIRKCGFYGGNYKISKGLFFTENPEIKL